MSTRSEIQVLRKIDIEQIAKNKFEDNIEISKKNSENVYEWKIVWINVVVLSLVHLGGLYGLYLRASIDNRTYVFGKLYGYCAAFGVTAGAHRLWSHKSFKANKTYQILVAILMSTTYQNSIYIWCRDHRLHHKHSETDADPHNANRGFFFSHVGWLLIRKHKDVIEKGKHLDMSDLKANPVVMFQHKFYYPIVILFSIIIPFFVPWYFFGESLKNSFFVIGLYRLMVTLNGTWGINSVAHLYGIRPYNGNIGPVENDVMSYITLGEGFHNYHHTYPWDYKAAEYGDDIRNVTTYFIDFCAWLGWVTERRTVDKSIIDSRVAKTGDGTRNEFCPSFFGFASSNLQQKIGSVWRFVLFAIFIYLL